MTTPPNADLVALITEAVRDAFDWYNEDIDRVPREVFTAEQVLALLEQRGFKVSRNGSFETQKKGNR